MLRGVLFVMLAALNVLSISLALAAGRNPSIIQLVFAPFFLYGGALAFTQRARIPVATGTSWGALHFRLTSGEEVHPVASIAKLTPRFSMNAGLMLHVQSVDGRITKYYAVSGTRARELRESLERSRAGMSAPGPHAPTLVARIPGAPATSAAPPSGAPPRAVPPSQFHFPAPQGPIDTSPAAAWNASVMANGTAIPDTSMNLARGSIDRHVGVWLSVDTSSMKKTVIIKSATIMVMVLAISLQIGRYSGAPLAALLAIGLALGLAVFYAVQRSMRPTYQGEAGTAIMMLPPTLTSATAVESVVAHASATAGFAAVTPMRKKNEVTWKLGEDVAVKGSHGTGGQIRWLVLRSKRKANLDAHKRFKGAVLEALGGRPGMAVATVAGVPLTAPPAAGAD